MNDKQHIVSVKFNNYFKILIMKSGHFIVPIFILNHSHGYL
jgi:hypothetical protein